MATAKKLWRAVRTFGVLGPGSRIPCLFYSRDDAEENRDHDERLVDVRVQILREVKPKVDRWAE